MTDPNARINTRWGHESTQPRGHLPECPVAERRGTVNDSDCTCYKHLPECILPKGYGDCICEELRALERRTLDAAREAVLALHPRCTQPCEMCAEWDDALAAIDALREGAK